MPLKFGHKQVVKPDGSTEEGYYAYECGHCGRRVSGAVVARVLNEAQTSYGRWLQCPECREGSFCDDNGKIYPGVKFGPVVEGLPEEVKEAYDEARNCLSVNATTASELLCRKILMHVAVDKEAKVGLTFAEYIDYLEKTGYITPPMREWVKLIKDNGNDATHKLPKPERKRAEGTLVFTAQLLRSIYEMGHLADQFTTPK